MHHDAVVAKIVYEEAVAAAQAQGDNLEAYRSRALVGLTAAGAFASLLSLEDAPRAWPFWLALVTAVVGISCVGSVLWPRDWKVNPANTGWTAFVNNPAHDESTTYAQLAIWHQQNVDDNDQVIGKVWRSYVWSIVAFAVAIAALTLNAVQPTADSVDEPLRVVLIEE